MTRPCLLCQRADGVQQKSVQLPCGALPARRLGCRRACWPNNVGAAQLIVLILLLLLHLKNDSTRRERRQSKEAQLTRDPISVVHLQCWCLCKNINFKFARVILRLGRPEYLLYRNSNRISTKSCTIVFFWSFKKWRLNLVSAKQLRVHSFFALAQIVR